MDGENRRSCEFHATGSALLLDEAAFEQARLFLCGDCHQDAEGQAFFGERGPHFALAVPVGDGGDGTDVLLADRNRGPGACAAGTGALPEYRAPASA